MLASVVATMPAAVRIAPAIARSSGAASVWLGLLALAFFPVSIATVTLRHALAALRLFDSRAFTTALLAIVVWVLVTFVSLAGLGALLRATTHHHGLAGVTFACVGLVVATLVAPFAFRFVMRFRSAHAPVGWAVLSAGALGAGVTLSYFAHVLARSPSAAATSIDVVAFVFAAAFGAGAFPYRSRPLAPLALAGPPLAAIVLVAGFAALRTGGSLRAAITEDAPAFAAVMALPGAARLAGETQR
jgi:hypothetical protein